MEVYVPVRRQTADYQVECRLLARQIKAWRLHKKLSLRRLHLLSDIPISRLADIEKTGRADPKFTTILRIARALEISVPELFYQSPETSNVDGRNTGAL